MGKQISVETRKIMIDLRKKGKKLREIAEITGRHFTSVKKIIDKYEKHRKVENFPKCGRPRKLNAREIKQIVRQVKGNPASSAVKIAEELTTTTEKTVSASTVRRALNENGLYGRMPRKKPHISKNNKKKRLKYVKKYKNYGQNFWEKVLFSDESKFEIFGCKNRKKIWREKNKEFQEQNITSTVKHGGGSVMVWGCMAASGVGNLVFIDSTMKKQDYLNILKENLPSSINSLGLPANWIFQQDNDPKHKSYLVREWLLYHTPKQLDHPPQSPDLNPIEHLWQVLDDNVRKRNVTSKETLQQVLTEEWSKITPEITKNLVHSMPRRLEAVLKAKGGQTKY